MKFVLVIFEKVTKKIKDITRTQLQYSDLESIYQNNEGLGEFVKEIIHLKKTKELLSVSISKELLKKLEQKKDDGNLWQIILSSVLNSDTKLFFNKDNIFQTLIRETFQKAKLEGKAKPDQAHLSAD